MFNSDQRFSQIRKGIFNRIFAMTLCAILLISGLIFGNFTESFTSVEAASYTIYGATNSYINSDIANSTSWGTSGTDVRVYASEHESYDKAQTGYYANFLVYKNKQLVAIFTECSTLPDTPKTKNRPADDSPTGFPAIVNAGDYSLTYKSSTIKNKYATYSVSATKAIYWNGSSFINGSCNGILIHSATDKANPSSGNQWSTGCLLVKDSNMSSFISLVGTGSASLRIVRESSPSTPSVPNIYYRVRTTAGSWLPEVTNDNTYAGSVGKAITDVAIRVSSGSVKYRVHVKDGSWISYVTGCNINDSINGYAGNGKAIDAVQIVYTAPSGTTYKSYYRVSPLNGTYYSYQMNDSTANGMDGYAGSISSTSKTIDKLQIYLGN